MAIISTLRNKMGKFLVFVVGFSIAAFVLGDILGPNNQAFNSQNNIIAEINGEDVNYLLYQSLFEELSYNFSLNNGRSPEAFEIESIRDQVWQRLIDDISYREEYLKLGIDVSTNEVVDMVQGSNIHPMVRQAFSDPNTNVFSPQNVISYLQSLSSQPLNQQEAWYAFEKNLKPMRMRSKYENLMSLTANVNVLESKKEYYNSNNKIDLSYFFIPFYEIEDSLFEISTDEMKNYLKKNKEDYTQSESRSIDYIFFPLTPSKDDSIYIVNEMERIKNSFLSEALNDSTFSVVNSDELNAYVNYKTDELPVELQNKEVGYISDVKFQNGNFIVNKLSEIVEENKYSARAKHILFKFDVTPKSEVRKEAQRVLNLLKNGSDFEETARTYSQDGSASNGGDLGWFIEGTMVLPFQNAVFSRSKTGLIPRIIESEFGYHLIYVSNTKTNLSYNVSTIVKVLVPSDYTKNFVYRESELFRSQVENKESFIKNVKESNYKMLSSNNLDKNDKKIADLNNSRSIIIWAYGDNTSLNSISDVIEMDEGYVIAIVSDIKEKGTKNLDDVNNSITKKILNNKKFEYVSNKLSDYKSLFDLTQLNNKGKIYNMNTLDFTTNSLSNVGYSPEAIGIAFSMEEGELTKPFMNDEGIVVMGLNSFIIADSIENYSEYSSSLLQANQLSTPFRIDNVIKEFSSIEDYRYKFF